MAEKQATKKASSSTAKNQIEAVSGYQVQPTPYDYLGLPRVAQAALETNNADSKALTAIYPAWNNVGHFESTMVDLPVSASAYFGAFAMGRFGGQGGNDDNGENQYNIMPESRGRDKTPISRHLPDNRVLRYAALRVMAMDPTIDCAIKMHLANAISPKQDGTDAIKIESIDGKDDPIVKELQNVILPYVRRDLNEWARKAAVYGSCFVRVYGKPKEGITNIRSDFYTHPRYVKKYEKGGKLAGFTTTYQGGVNHAQQLRLLPPWCFVGFEIPEWWDREFIEPRSVTGIPVDLSVEDENYEGLVESIEYGTSIIATAYGPWLDLLDAVCSLKMSRRNAARLERIVGVNTEKLDPERAARYLDMIAERISNASEELTKQSWLDGNVQTVVNHIIPIQAAKGGIQIDAVQGTPDIQGIEDVMYHIKRLGGALGIDPSLLGFGDMLSGGLGDGGFFRVSSLAATKANLLRTALKNGIQRLCEIHVAYKYNKVFTLDEYPWKITFNSVANALEREAQENLESRSNVVLGLAQLVSTVDQEYSLVERRELLRHMWKFMEMDEKEFETIFPESKVAEANKTQEQQQGEAEEGM